MKPILTGLVFVAVVQELDAVKRSENGARNAIRWLEREFKEGKFVALFTHIPNSFLYNAVLPATKDIVQVVHLTDGCDKICVCMMSTC